MYKNEEIRHHEASKR